MRPKGGYRGGYKIRPTNLDEIDFIQSKKTVGKLISIDILDKIRAEIEQLETYYDNDYFSGNRDAMLKCNDVLKIIDKYKAESEE